MPLTPLHALGVVVCPACPPCIIALPYSCPMRCRVRMAHALILRYGLYKHLEVRCGLKLTHCQQITAYIKLSFVHCLAQSSQPGTPTPCTWGFIIDAHNGCTLKCIAALLLYRCSSPRYPLRSSWPSFTPRTTWPFSRSEAKCQ